MLISVYFFAAFIFIFIFRVFDEIPDWRKWKSICCLCYSKAKKYFRPWEFMLSSMDADIDVTRGRFTVRSFLLDRLILKTKLIAIISYSHRINYWLPNATTTFYYNKNASDVSCVKDDYFSLLFPRHSLPFFCFPSLNFFETLRIGKKANKSARKTAEKSCRTKIVKM